MSKAVYFISTFLLLLTFISSSCVAKEPPEDDAPMRIPECGHLTVKNGQANSYMGAHGRCCLCPMGTRLAEECSGNNPNSTRCEICEYNDERQTYVDYGPHDRKECIKDITSCHLPMRLVKGSPTSKSSCRCPEGKVLRDKFFCVPEPTKTTQVTTTQSIKPTSSSTQPTTRSVSKRVLFPRTTTGKRAEDRVTTTHIIDHEATVVHVKGADETSKIPTSLWKTRTPETTPKMDTNNETNIYAALACVGIMLLIILAVVLRRKKVLCSKNPDQTAKMESLNSSSATVSSDDTISDGRSDQVTEENEKLLGRGDSDKRDALEMGYVSEQPPVGNKAGPLRAGETRGPIPERQGEVQAPDADRNQPRLSPRQGHLESPGNDPRLSEGDKQKRYQAFDEMAIVMKRRDALMLGNTLLPTGSEFEDIKRRNEGDTPNMVREMLRRAIELNPKLSLEQLREHVSGIGYLVEIVEKNIQD